MYPLIELSRNTGKLIFSASSSSANILRICIFMAGTVLSYKVVVSKMEITTKYERPQLQKPGASLSKVASEAAPRITST